MSYLISVPKINNLEQYWVPDSKKQLDLQNKPWNVITHALVLVADKLCL